MMSPGPNLRILREQLGLTTRDVATASARLARRHNNEEYGITTDQLSDFETIGAIPSTHRLYSLAIIYRREFGEMLNWYGLDLNQTASGLETCAPPRTHFSYTLPSTEEVTKPVRIDPSFDPRTTSNCSPMIKQWGTLPVAYLQQLSNKNYSYGYIGNEDLTMHPILPPGSFIQVDKSRNRVLQRDWRRSTSAPSTSSRPGRAIPAAGVHSHARSSFFSRTRCPLLRQGFFLCKRWRWLGKSLGRL
jgi:transcriptional regulator with XRE-family HTH domain